MMSARSNRRLNSARLFRVELKRVCVHGRIRIIGGTGLLVGAVVTAGQLARGVRFDMGTTLSKALQVSAALAVITSVFVGAHSIGSSAAMESLPGQLLFEPRRTRLLITRATAAVVVSWFLALGSFAMTLALCAVGSKVTGSEIMLNHRADGLVRVILGSGTACVMGFFVAVLTRSAAIASGGFLAFVIVIEPVTGALIKHGERWLPVQAVMTLAIGDVLPTRLGISPIRAFTVAATWAVALGVCGAIQFRTRDE